MIQERYLKWIFIIPLLFLLFFVVPVLASPPNVTLKNPSDNQILNSTNNVTFVCNAADDQRVDYLALYHNNYGNFSL